MKLINVSDEPALKAAGIPYTRESLYQMHYKKQCPKIFVKLARYLMIDVEAWEKNVVAIMAERDRKITKRT